MWPCRRVSGRAAARRSGRLEESVLRVHHDRRDARRPLGLGLAHPTADREADVLVAGSRSRRRSPERVPGVVARIHDRPRADRVRLHRLRPDGALVPDREADPGTAGLDLRLHPRLPRPGDPERRQHALLEPERLPGLPTAHRADADLRRAGAVLAREVERRLVDLHHGDPPDRALRPLSRVRPGQPRRTSLGRPRPRHGDVPHVHVVDLQLRPPDRPASTRSTRSPGSRPRERSSQR